ncbi:MAG TPA: hypothetical protein VFU15_14675 [Bacteroidia bacterium]|nr:hypothetical protein [Bacteroidia bacterium]
MTPQEILSQKDVKPKEKTEMISRMLSEKKFSAGEWLELASAAKDPVKATLIEAMEFSTKEVPALLDEPGFDFLVRSLSAKAPRVKWESAKTIGNTAQRFPHKLDEAVEALKKNAADEGTVVRWSAAFALGEIVKLNLPLNKQLVPLVKKIMEKEEKNSIRKIYAAALKKAAG